MKRVILFRTAFLKMLLTALTAAMCAGLAFGQTTADIDALVQKTIDATSVPAVGLAVVKDGKVIVAKGYGVSDGEGGVMASANTGFQIASVTKQFTAVGIMKLIEDGKLSLNDTLGKYLTDVPAKWSGVTIRQLLNQVSGIPNYTEGGKLVQTKNYSHAEILDLVKDVPPAFEPGTKWQYSNTNYFLLGMIIEKVSGKSYPDYMRDRVFKPLGMTSTVVNTSGLKIDNAAFAHKLDAGVWKHVVMDDPSQPFAAGAIVSTPADMAKWAIAQSDTKLLKKTSWDEVFASGKLADAKPTGYGFGWRMQNTGDISYLGHSGGIAGFNSFIVRFPNENVSVVVLVNRNSRVPEPLALDIAALYIPKLAATLAAQKAAAPAPIADADPETTKFLRGAFDKMLSGDISPDLFDAQMQKLLFPDNVKQLKQQLGEQGGIKFFELTASENTDAGKRRVYRITFQTGLRLTGSFFLDPQGKIAGAGFRPE
jgi:D-alanyl-D-alanine carboxypeptidase